MNLISTIIVIVLGCTMGLFSFQDRMIFYPVAPDNANYSRYQSNEIAVTSHGFKIQGWKFTNKHADNEKTILYFGGNAEDVTFNFSEVSLFGARQVFFFNYRGYGQSQGKPSQKALYEDGLSIYDELLKSHGVLPDQLIVVGRSLGSAVATYIAAKRDVCKVVLVTPFDSLENVAKSIFPFLPVSWFLNHPFPSLKYAPDIQVPVLMLIASNDEVIPMRLSQNLYDLWGGQKQWVEFPGMGHNDIQIHRDYFPVIQAFVKGDG